jgi:heme/copper-type cytochrome/quinol oxidase subunit 2
MDNQNNMEDRLNNLEEALTEMKAVDAALDKSLKLFQYLFSGLILIWVVFAVLFGWIALSMWHFQKSTRENFEKVVGEQSALRANVKY